MIVWDEPKRLSNISSHQLDFEHVRDRFDFAEADLAESYGGRLVATGFLDDQLVTIVFAPLGAEGISLISARRASRRERRAYDRRS